MSSGGIVTQFFEFNTQSLWTVNFSFQNINGAEGWRKSVNVEEFKIEYQTIDRKHEDRHSIPSTPIFTSL